MHLYKVYKNVAFIFVSFKLAMIHYLIKKKKTSDEGT